MLTTPKTVEKEGIITGVSAEDVKGLGRERAEYFGGLSLAARVIAALRFLINDMRKLPGRKAIVLFSDGLVLSVQTCSAQLRLLVDYANRSGIVIHTIDARGLVNPDFIGPAENPSEAQRDSLRQVTSRVHSLARRVDWLIWPSKPAGLSQSIPTTSARVCGAHSKSREAIT